MVKSLFGIFKLFQAAILFSLAFVFIGWYIKMHFHPKWFPLFWIYTALSLALYFNHQAKIKSENDPRSGAEIWQENH